MNSNNNDEVLNDATCGELLKEKIAFERWFYTVLVDASDSVPRGGTSWAFAGGAKHNAWQGWKAAKGLYK